jgi:hypothetical protein
MEIININDDRYIIKKKFTLSSVKNEELLVDFKEWWSADTVIKSEPHDLIIFAQKIPSIEFEEILNDT